jgi:hypothetical protein
MMSGEEGELEHVLGATELEGPPGRGSTCCPPFTLWVRVRQSLTESVVNHAAAASVHKQL